MIHLAHTMRLFVDRPIVASRVKLFDGIAAIVLCQRSRRKWDKTQGFWWGSSSSRGNWLIWQKQWMECGVVFYIGIYRELHSFDAIGNDKSDKKRSFVEGHLYAVLYCGIVSWMRTERLNSHEKNWWIKDDGIHAKKHASRIWHQMRCLWIDWIFDLSISSNLLVFRRFFFSYTYSHEMSHQNRSCAFHPTQASARLCSLKLPFDICRATSSEIENDMVYLEITPKMQKLLTLKWSHMVDVNATSREIIFRLNRKLLNRKCG